jgi:predicted ferric reductase
MKSSWLLYMCLCFTNLWNLPDYCTCTFASPVHDIFLIIVHVTLLHQSMIYHYYYTCTFAFLVSWLFYLYLCCTCLYIFIAPQKPFNVTGVATSDPNTLQVTWQQPLPRPGITTYTVKVYEEKDDDATEFIYKEGGKISGLIM